MRRFCSVGSRVIILVSLWCLGMTALPVHALDAGLAPTPPMGWNSWNKFGCNVSDSLIRATSDALVASGLRDAGYQYVIIDDCWQRSRDADGHILADPERFPSGMKALADYVHSKGLKFGLYSDAGEYTCQHRPGSRGHESDDARSYAAWGVDYLKYDWCSSQGEDARAAYARMHEALIATGRPIVFSLCEWGLSRPWTWAAGIGQLWRTTGDIRDCFDCAPRAMGLPPAGAGGRPPDAPGGPPTAPPGPPPAVGASTAAPPPMGLGVLQILDQEAELTQAAGPGHWNDPDMLEVGNPGLSDTESRAHFSLWSMLAAPLIAGNDVRQMPAAIGAILGNREVIAVDQDTLGVQGHRLWRRGATEVWVKRLADGALAVALLNRDTAPRLISVTAGELGVSPGRSVRDLWRHQDAGALPARLRRTVEGHGVVLLRLASP